MHKHTPRPSIVVAITSVLFLALAAMAPASAQDSYPPTIDDFAVTFDVADPYVCGGGFFGNISGGVGPYSLTYTLTPAEGDAIVLPVVTIDNPGDYVTPDDLIDYSTFVDGTYGVVLVAVDSEGTTLDPAASFDALITDECAPATTSGTTDGTTAGTTDGTTAGTTDGHTAGTTGGTTTTGTTTAAAGTTTTGGIFIGNQFLNEAANSNPPSTVGGNFGGIPSSFTSLADAKNARTSGLPKIGTVGGGAAGDPALDGAAGGTTSPTLAITGSSTAQMVAAALGLLAAGFVLTGLASRRRAE